MVSIIIPTFNRAHLIEHSIRSVLNQTYPWFELLVVDDGSTDNTRDVVEQIADERVRYIAMTKNQGAATARNYGVKCAKYDYIAFQDSDDAWESEKLEKEMRILTRTAEDVGLIYSAYRYHSVGGTIDGIGPDITLEEEYKNGYIFPFLLDLNLVAPPTVIVKRQVWEETGGFDERFRWLEDYEWILRLSQKYKVVFVNEPLVQVHGTIESVSGNTLGVMMANCLIIAMYKKQMIEYGLLEGVLNRLLGKVEGTAYKEIVVDYLQKLLVQE